MKQRSRGTGNQLRTSEPRSAVGGQGSSDDKRCNEPTNQPDDSGLAAPNESGMLRVTPARGRQVGARYASDKERHELRPLEGGVGVPTDLPPGLLALNRAGPASPSKDARLIQPELRIRRWCASVRGGREPAGLTPNRVGANSRAIDPAGSPEASGGRYGGSAMILGPSLRAGLLEPLPRAGLLECPHCPRTVVVTWPPPGRSQEAAPA